MREERCCLCDQATGRAGRGEDSIYIDLTHANLGPLCPECYADMRTHFEDDTAPIEHVEKELADAGITGVSFAQASKMLKRIADLTLELADARELLAARNLNTIFSSDIYTAMRERAEQAERELAVEQEANRNNVAMHCQQIADLTREMDEARAANAEFIDSIPEALAQYRCQHMVYENYDGGMALVDVFSIGSDIATIKPGLDELELLADFIQSYKPNPGQPLLDELARLRRLAAALGNKLLAERIIGVHDEPHYPEYCRACADNELLANFVQAVREAAKAANPTGKDSEA